MRLLRWSRPHGSKAHRPRVPSYDGKMLKALRWVIFALVVYFFVLPLIPGFRNAVRTAGNLHLYLGCD